MSLLLGLMNVVDTSLALHLLKFSLMKGTSIHSRYPNFGLSSGYLHSLLSTTVDRR
jgi:hypothetical protein